MRRREAKKLHGARIEQALSKIGAKIADATELSQRAKELCVHSEMVLINVRQELEELYVSLKGQ